MKFFGTWDTTHFPSFQQPQLKPEVLLWTCVAQELGFPLLLAASHLSLPGAGAQHLLHPPLPVCSRGENAHKYGVEVEGLFLHPAFPRRRCFVREMAGCEYRMLHCSWLNT